MPLVAEFQHASWWTDEVFDRAEKDDTTLREAAFDIAVERVARAAQIRGYVS